MFLFFCWVDEGENLSVTCFVNVPKTVTVFEPMRINKGTEYHFFHFVGREARGKFIVSFSDWCVFFSIADKCRGEKRDQNKISDFFVHLKSPFLIEFIYLGE
jgi:hypothetical protein